MGPRRLAAWPAEPVAEACTGRRSAALNFEYGWKSFHELFLLKTDSQARPSMAIFARSDLEGRARESGLEIYGKALGDRDLCARALHRVCFRFAGFQNSRTARSHSSAMI